MNPLSDEHIKRHRYLLMAPDETVLEAIALLRDEGGYDWWYLVVELSDGSYALAPFASLAPGIEAEGASYLDRPLRDLIGDPLQRADVLIDIDDISLDDALTAAAGSDIGLATLLRGGMFYGLLPVGRTRGAFDTGLVTLAGRYAELPEKGLISRRRNKRAKRFSAQGKSQSDDKQDGR